MLLLPSFRSFSLRRGAAVAIAVAGAVALLATVQGCGGGGATAIVPTPAPPAALPSVDISTVTVADPGSTLAPNWEHGATMQIFVRSYADSDGDGHGDLRGLMGKLDYLAALGIKALWLLPVHKSQDGDHGYAVADYRGIETAYGSLADFDELLRQAHARGIGVTLDYVMNHSAATNPLFTHSRDSAANSYRDWFVWQSPAPTGWSLFGGNPWRSTAIGAYYAPFWDQMPDWNLLNPAVVNYHANNLRFWLNRGVDGFRFDAVGNLVENGPNAQENQPRSVSLMGEMRAVMNAYSQRSLVCEAPGDVVAFGAANSCGSAFAFGLQGRIIAAARGDVAAIQAVSDYFKTAPTTRATFLSNHDSFAGDRPWNQLGGNLAQLKLAAATLLLLPGRPFIYYGEELGMANAATIADDGKLRSPMSWAPDSARAGFTTGAPYRALSANVSTHNAQTELAEPASLLAHYRSLLALRNASPALARGSYEQAFVSGAVMGYQRVLGAARSLVLINYGNSEATLDVAALPANADLSNAWPAGAASAAANASGVARLSVAAQSARVWSLP